MESQRSILVIGLVFVSFLLWQQWHNDYGPKPQVVATESTSDYPSDLNNVEETNDHVPKATATSEGIEAVEEETVADRQFVTVNTDTLEVIIDTKGGDVISGKLKQYPVEAGSETPFTMFNTDKNTLYIAQSGLIGKNGPDSSAEGRPIYSVPESEYSLTGEELVVPLTFSKDGIEYVKNFKFNKDSHAIEVEYLITNRQASPIVVQQYAQLKQSTLKREGSMFMPTYRGGAYSTSEERYEKYDFEDIADANLRETTLGGWVAMLEHYFVSAWVPPQDAANNIYSRLISGKDAVLGYTSDAITIASNESDTISSTLYLGPKHQDTLAELADGLDLTVDYGFLFWLAQPLFSLLSFIQSLVINWGASIIIITIIVKGLMYPLTKAQYESMAKLRALQPKMQALKERHGDDRQKMSQGMMELYKKEKVNPMGGCFPLLLQMPIFLALYWVLLESVELRHADFVFWITDLSVKDPFFVLPVLTGASMYLLQKLQPMTVQDPMQQKIMQWMPVFMSIFFLWFPAGLVLYWLISNVITLAQAKMIYSSMEKRGIKTH